jgi:hypothetical protein
VWSADEIRAVLQAEDPVQLLRTRGQHQVEDDQRVAASAMSLSSSIMRTVSGPFIVIPVQNIRTNARPGETPSFSLSAAPRLTAGSDYTLM